MKKLPDGNAALRKAHAGNCWAAGFTYRKLRTRRFALQDGKRPTTVLAELDRILREKVRVPDETITEYVALLREEVSIVEAAPILAVRIRDESDVPVLSEAVAGNAEVLVTGDRDLLEISEKIALEILTPRGLWERLRRDVPPSR